MSELKNPCLLFDVDGTLVDSDKVHLIAFNEICGRYGVTIDEVTYRMRISGRMNCDIFADFLGHVPQDQHEAIGREKEALFRSMATTIAPLDGVMDLLDWADANGIPFAAVTNAPIENVRLVMKAIGAVGRFKALILADDVGHPKPHPLPYQTGLQRLGGNPERTLAFEDSKAGIQSATSAGLTVAGLTTSHDSNALLGFGAALTATNYQDEELKRFIRDRVGRA